jgi:TATA-box binding protein (TBP) (component of TFIID and TFIIIB)
MNSSTKSSWMMMMDLRIVNQVWRGQMDMMVDLVGLKEVLNSGKVSSVQTARHQIKQPEQLIIKFRDGTTMLIFKSGKFRIMGHAGDVDSLAMHFNVFNVADLFDFIPDIVFQTMTATCKFPNPINLNKLSYLHPISTRYNPELFPACQVLTYKPVSVNVFASGKVTICGLKDIELARDVIIRDLRELLIDNGA